MEDVFPIEKWNLTRENTIHFYYTLWIQVPPEKIQIAPKLYPSREFRAADPWIHRDTLMRAAPLFRYALNSAKRFRDSNPGAIHILKK